MSNLGDAGKERHLKKEVIFLSIENRIKQVKEKIVLKILTYMSSWKIIWKQREHVCKILINQRNNNLKNKFIS